MSFLIVDNDLATDSAGAIKTYLSDSTDGKRERADLWFATAIRSVPFLNYGNDLLTWIFETMNDNEIQAKANNVAMMFEKNYGLDVIDKIYDINKDERKIKISFTLRNSPDYVISL